ncbi:cell division protein ZapA [Rhabdaerophilum sp. SD176]|uniref:cell division protein ZapA n=1 Tax=Rhabdaerophilum sp. SD176 TaxID=2983548 RepID=UPI0024E03B39|nr:cell division protein ZapA [Rhabdaerophilum sp. SD176]
MAHVTVTIDGKQFRMACEDGQEQHLEALALDLDNRIRMVRESFGEIGDLRLTVMAALMVTDELFEERRKGTELQQMAEQDRHSRQNVHEAALQRDNAIAASLDGLTQRIDRIARMLSAPKTESRHE